MSDLIRNLNNVTAQQILDAIARSRARANDQSIPWSLGLAQALAQEFQIKPASAPVSDGDLARQALLVLAEDPETRKAIEAMAAQAERGLQRFDFGASIGLTVAVLIVLQTHVKFERDSNGKWSLKLEKKPTSDALLKGLVQKLIAYAK
jgi:hypothetical protein